MLAEGVAIRDLGLPENTSIALIVRGSDLVSPRGSTVLQSDDQVYVSTSSEARPLLTLLLGSPNEV